MTLRVICCKESIDGSFLNRWVLVRKYRQSLPQRPCKRGLQTCVIDSQIYVLSLIGITIAEVYICVKYLCLKIYYDRFRCVKWSWLNLDDRLIYSAHAYAITTTFQRPYRLRTLPNNLFISLQKLSGNGKNQYTFIASFIRDVGRIAPQLSICVIILVAVVVDVYRDESTSNYVLFDNSLKSKISGGILETRIKFWP